MEKNYQNIPEIYVGGRAYLLTNFCNNLLNYTIVKQAQQRFPTKNNGTSIVEISSTSKLRNGYIFVCMNQLISKTKHAKKYPLSFDNRWTLFGPFFWQMHFTYLFFVMLLLNLVIVL